MAARVVSRGLSYDQHRVTITVKPIFLFNRLLIGPHYQLPAGKGAGQHKQGGLRQMKVSQQAVHRFKLIARINK